MNHSDARANISPFVSTFLSHSSADKPLVEAVARCLGRRGVLTWFDKEELMEMGSLSEMLRQAVQQQATLTIFLSENSIKSAWCRDELKWAIEAGEGTEHLLPVYLGNPLKLVREHDLLQSRFLHIDGDRVEKLGYACQQSSESPDPEAIADKIANTAYKRSIPQKWSDAVIYIDQRGNGRRRGIPSLPEDIACQNLPTLTFRPDLGSRQPRELLAGKDWDDMVKTMTRSLSQAFETVRDETRKIRVLGHTQTGLIWAIGRHFDRTTSVELYGYGRNSPAISNKGQERRTSLSGGDPDAAELTGSQPARTDSAYSEVALGVGKKASFSFSAQKAVPNLPLFWIESGLIDNSEQAMKLVSDIVASVQKLRQQHDVHKLVLFWTTANHVALLAAANLTSHVIPSIKFMEWDHDSAKYVPLDMPSSV